jgi:uncharacterized protein (DUF1697 family)
MPSSCRYAALLRGINVGGKNKIAMGPLRDIFTALGHDDVVTYIQSGNVVFTSSKAASRIASGIEAAIAESFGFAVPVVLRSNAELAAVVLRNPFAIPGVDTSTLHVAFLGSASRPELVARLDPMRSPPDRFNVIGSEIFLQYPNGSGRSKLTVDYFERQLETRATARNWNTVNKLVALTNSS